MEPLDPNPDYKPLNEAGWGIQPLGPSPLGGDIHETFQVSEAGELHGGHTTIRLPGGATQHLDWQE